MRPSRPGEAGRGTGCVIGIVVVLIVACVLAFFAGRILAAPVQDPAPSGPSHGTTPEAIAATLVSSASAQLQHGPNATVTLSDRDLTVIAQQRNPDPGQFTDPTVTVASGELLVMAHSRVGPFSVVESATVSLSLGTSGSAPTILANVTGFTVGRQWVPGWMRAWFDPRGDGLIPVDPILNSNPALEQMRPLLECVAVTHGGVTLGFHRPGAPADPGVCVPNS